MSTSSRGLRGCLLLANRSSLNELQQALFDRYTRSVVP